MFNNIDTFKPPRAKRAFLVKIIKIDLFTGIDRIQFKFTKYEIWDIYQAY